MIRWLIILLFNSILAAGQVKDDLVRVTVPKVMAEAGMQSVINILVEVKNGYHIQTHEVKQDGFILSTTLEIDGGKEFIIDNQVFPTAKKFTLEGTDQYLDVYDGKFEIQTFFTPGKNIHKNIHHLNGKLNYQACDSLRCLFPRTVEFLIDVEVR